MTICLFSIIFAFAANAELQKVGVVGAANQTLSAVDETKASRNLALGQDIFINDTLSTDLSGNAQLMFIDKSALTIGPNASVVVDKFVYNPAEGSGELTMRGTKGAFRFIGGALSKKQEVKFNTPVGTIGIRGGIAIVEINPTSGATNATFLYGDKMTFRNSSGQMQETINPGFAIGVATPTSAPTVPVAVDTAALTAKIQQNFTSTSGQSGGAKEIPTSDRIEKSGGTITKDNKSPDGKTNAGGGEGGDRKQNDGRQANKDGEGKNNQEGSGKFADGRQGQSDRENNRDAGGQNGNGNGGFANDGSTKPEQPANDGGTNTNSSGGKPAPYANTAGPNSPKTNTPPNPVFSFGGPTAAGTFNSASGSNNFNPTGPIDNVFSPNGPSGPNIPTSTNIINNAVSTTTTATTSNNTGTAYTNNLQTEQNYVANSHTGAKYSLDNIAIPVDSVTSAMVKEEAFDHIGGLKNEINTRKNNYCSTCNYVNWDVWAKVIPNPNVTSQSTAQAKLIPYVYGTLTPVTNIPYSGSATYHGPVMGTTLGTGGLTNQIGNINATINLNGGSTYIASGGITGNLGSFNFANNSAITFNNSAQFNGAGLNINGATTPSGTINGGLFGPAAQNIGGNLNFTSGGTTGAGVYIGSK